jgi:DNA-binding transcriptional regulator YdaS (Cro superfamily)
MNLKEYIATSDRGTAKKLAAFLGISAPYLSQMAAGKSPISEKRCVQIERFSAGRVSRRDLRPDDWRDIWPELANSPSTDPADDVQPPTGGEVTQRSEGT